MKVSNPQTEVETCDEISQSQERKTILDALIEVERRNKHENQNLYQVVPERTDAERAHKNRCHFPPTTCQSSLSIAKSKNEADSTRTVPLLPKQRKEETSLTSSTDGKDSGMSPLIK
jgi:hypothetical protein